jgi:hypothetical protein
MDLPAIVNAPDLTEDLYDESTTEDGAAEGG